MSVKLEVFTSKSCPYCPMAVSAAEEVVKELGDQVDYEHLDVDENIDKVREYQIMSIPTVVVDGEVAFIGAPTPEELSKKIRKTLLRKH
ncbi:MAG: thioredoxin [Methanosphaera sp. rholeuAM270]|nr:MAG: thioredoxin [Methanosphaera sp. rholeuAM270]